MNPSTDIKLNKPKAVVNTNKLTDAEYREALRIGIQEMIAKGKLSLKDLDSR